MSVFDAKPFEKLLAVVRDQEGVRYEAWVWPGYGVVAPARTTSNGNVRMVRDAIERDLASEHGYTVEYLVPPDKWLETYKEQTKAYDDFRRACRAVAERAQ